MRTEWSLLYALPKDLPVVFTHTASTIAASFAVPVDLPTFYALPDQEDFQIVDLKGFVISPLTINS